MSVTTVRDLGTRVRAARTARQMTQADLAEALHVSRDWVVRLEKGHPRLEAQKVLDALVVLGLTLDVDTAPTPVAGKKGAPKPSAQAAKSKPGRQSTKKAETKDRRVGQDSQQATSKKAGGSAQSSGSARASAPDQTDDPFDALFGRR